MITQPEVAEEGQVVRWAVPVLGFGVFVVGTGEFVLAGLLPLLSRSLDVTVAVAGQVITAFALTCAVAGPVLTALTARWARRRVLLLALAVYILGSAVTAVAGSYAVVVLAQVAAAFGVGVFIPTASVTAAALVPAERSGRAIAVAVTGFTAAVALGAPLGTALGGLLGWRATMWFTAALGVVGLLGVRLFIPPTTNTPAPPGLVRRLQPLRDRRVALILGTTLVGFTAVYIPYTYVGVVFESATGGDGVRLAVLMVTLGLIGTAGNLLAGGLADRAGGARVVATALVWLAVSMVVMPFATESFAAAIAAIACYGIAAFAITTPQQHRLVSAEPAAASVLVALNQAILYLAIALSGVVGGIGVNWVGGHRVSWLAAALAVIALGLSQLARTQEHRPGGAI